MIRRRFGKHSEASLFSAWNNIRGRTERNEKVVSQVVAAKLQKDGKEYYWKVPEGMKTPKPGKKVLVESKGGIIPAKVVAVIENPEFEPTAFLVNEKYGPWRQEHPSKSERAWKEEMALWKKDGLDITPYRAEHYSVGQLRQLRMGLKMGLNISAFADKTWRPDEMEKKRRSEMLRLGKALGLIPANATNRQARELLAGLEQGVDITRFNAPGTSWKKMHYTRLCLRAGVAPEELENLSAKEIRQRWIALKKSNTENKREGDMNK